MTTTILVVDPMVDNDPIVAEAARDGAADLIFCRSKNGVLEDEALYARADAVLNYRGRHLWTASALRKLTRCRVIQQGGVGYNHIDVEQAARQGIAVLNTPDYGTTEVAGHAVGLALSLLRGIHAYDRRLRLSNQFWDPALLTTVRRTIGLRVGIVGLGRIGTAAALRFKAFDMDVAFYDPYVPPGQELALGLKRYARLEDLLGRSDVLSLHCLLNAETRHLINAETIGLLPDQAILINTARGGVVDLAALRAALESGRLSGAALDVFETEPLDRDDPLIAAWSRGEEWLDGRLILTPHAAFYSTASIVDMRGLAVKYLLQYLRDGRGSTCVNADLLEARSGSR